jgi:serine/threonine-protein kinase
MLRRYADAVRAYDQALSLAPDLHVAAIDRAWTYVRWQGQMDTLRVVLDRIPQDAQLGFFGDVAAERAHLALWERDSEGLLQTLQTAHRDAFDAQEFYLPIALFAGWAYRMRGDAVAARAAFDSACVLLKSTVRRLPEDSRVHVALGLALAGLGRRDEALGEARWLQRSSMYRDDAFLGPVLAEDRAKILAQAGDAEAALDEISRVLARPAPLSVQTLRLDPLWDPIREHPRFKALLAKYGSGASH